MLGLLCALAMDITSYRDNKRNQLKAKAKKEVNLAARCPLRLIDNPGFTAETSAGTRAHTKACSHQRSGKHNNFFFFA